MTVPASRTGTADGTVTPGTDTPLVRFERRGSVAVLTLNRPAVRNAVDSALAAALGAALELAERIAADATLSLQAAKRLLRASSGGTPDDELWRINAERRPPVRHGC